MHLSILIPGFITSDSHQLPSLTALPSRDSPFLLHHCHDSVDFPCSYCR